MIEGRRAARRQTENVAADRLPWTNNPAALAMLAGETGAGEFSLRPPIGFNLKRSGPPTWGWVGEPHDRNPGPILAITTAELEKKDVAKSLDDGLSDALTGVSNRYVEWQVSDSERGDIAGRPFVRVFWAGVRRLDAPEPVRGQKAHGFVYLTCDNRRATTIVFQDAEPGYRASMLSCQAAVLTYRGAKPQ
jgi:hypothetical protein